MVYCRYQELSYKNVKKDLKLNQLRHIYFGLILICDVRQSANNLTALVN